MTSGLKRWGALFDKQFVQIDSHECLQNQGPFDLIVHKSLHLTPVSAVSSSSSSSSTHAIDRDSLGVTISLVVLSFCVYRNISIQTKYS